MNGPVLVVMAAGMGSRYGGLKQLDPVGEHGELLMDYSLYDAFRAGFRDVVFLIRKSMDGAFRQAIGDRIARIARVEYAYQELDSLPEGYAPPEWRTKPWGTGHAVWCCRRLLAGRPFAVVNADDYYGPQAFRGIYRFLSGPAGAGGAAYAMAGYRLENTLTENGFVSRGICEVADGFLQSVTERARIERSAGRILYRESDGECGELSGRRVVSMNLWGFPGAFLPELDRLLPPFLDKAARDGEQPEFYLPEAVNALLREGAARVAVLPSEDHWYGITYREDKPGVVCAIRRMTGQGKYPRNLWEGYGRTGV